MRRLLTSGERFSMQNEERAKDLSGESTSLRDREKSSREGMRMSRDTQLPVKTKIRDCDRVTQFCRLEAKQTESSRLSPYVLKFFAKHKGNVDISTLPPWRFKLRYVRAGVFHPMPDSIHLASFN